MALRNYLYAKHLDPLLSTLINKENMPKQENTCPPERALVLDDGTKVCANCSDCPKKRHDDGAPRLRVQIEHEVDFTTYKA